MKRKTIHRIIMEYLHSNRAREAQIRVAFLNAHSAKRQRVFHNLNTIRDEIKRLKELHKAISYLKKVHKRIPK